MVSRRLLKESQQLQQPDLSPDAFLLPKWARLICPQIASQDEHGDAGCDEDNDDDDRYLRTMAYHRVAAQFDHALTAVLEEIVGPVVHTALTRLQQLSASAGVVAPRESVDSSHPHMFASSLPAPTTLSTCGNSSLENDRHADLVSWFTLRRRSHVTSKAAMTRTAPEAAAGVTPTALEPPPSSNVDESTMMIDNSTTESANRNRDDETTTKSNATNTLRHSGEPDGVVAGSATVAGSYHPLMLPLLMVQAPFWPCDRTTFVSYMVQSTKQNQPLSCVVSIPNRNGSDEDWLSRARGDILRQCLAQEPDATLGQRYEAHCRRRQRHRKHSSANGVTESLVWWASHTRSYTAIVVVIHADRSHDLYSRPNVMDLIHWLADRRCHYGLPFTVVLCEPIAHRRHTPFASCLSSCVGLLVHRVTLPTTTTLCQAWYRRVADTVPPHFFSDDDDESFRQGMWTQQTNSLMQVIAWFKQRAAYTLVQPGSYQSVIALLGRNDDGTDATTATAMQAWCPNDHCKRITSLAYRYVVVGTAKKRKLEPSISASLPLLQWLVDREVKCQVRRVTQLIRSQLFEFTTTPPAAQSWFPYTSGHRPLSAALENAVVNQEHRLSILITLHSCRNDVILSRHSFAKTAFAYLDMLPGDRAPYEAAIREQTVMSINELIVLLDQCSTLSMAVFCLDTLVDPERTLAWSESPCATLDSRASTPKNSPQPRRDQVRALLRPAPLKERGSSFRIPTCLYHIIRDRGTIAETEWFEGFVTTALDPTHPYQCALPLDASAIPMFHWFACGVRQLEIAGLVRRRRIAGKNGESVTYDKTALVWCSGD